MKIEQRVALVIGNSKYNSNKLLNLKNPVNDARAMRNKLKKLGFKVFYGENLTVRQMDKKLDQFALALQRGGVGLFFFAGHGIEYRHENYLMAKNSKVNDKIDVKYESLPLDKVLDEMQDAGNRLNIVLLDACRSDPFSRGGGGLAKSTARGTFIVYATSPGDVASDGSGNHGAFTQQILKYIDAPGVPIERVFKRVKVGVINATHQNQRPWVSNDITGDFYFILPKNGATASAVQTILNPKAIRKYSLTIITQPSDAKVSITNIKLRYTDGILLKSGNYKVKISKKGYKTKYLNVDIDDTPLYIEVVLHHLNNNQYKIAKDRGSYIQPAMVHIKKGSFMMGSNDGRSNEKPVHRVNIDYNFYIGKYEVSVGEFRKFINDTGYRTDAEKGDGCWVLVGSDWKQKSDANWKNPYFSQDDSHPAVCISHNDAKAYTRWLSRKTDKNFRLPTEAEWEFVARAGTTTKYSFGDSSDMFCRYGNGADQDASSDVKAIYRKKGWNLLNCSDGYAYTSPVGSFNSNPWGVYDIHGNVYEWCEDWYADNYENTPTNGNNNSGSHNYRVLRGGSWYDRPWVLWSANRFSFNSDGSSYYIGFRLLLEH